MVTTQNEEKHEAEMKKQHTGKGRPVETERSGRKVERKQQAGQRPAKDRKGKQDRDERGGRGQECRGGRGGV